MLSCLIALMDYKRWGSLSNFLLYLPKMARWLLVVNVIPQFVEIFRFKVIKQNLTLSKHCILHGTPR